MKPYRIISVLSLIIALTATYSASACTTAVISARASANGKPMLWKQRDTDNKWNHIEYMRGERYGFTGIVNSEDSSRADVWGGVNEAGFAIINNASYNLKPDSLSDPHLEGVVMKKALGICATVDEFELYLLSMPKPCGLETNYGVIDACGGAAYFEVGDFGFTRYDAADAPDGYLIRTNFSFSGRKDEGAGYVRYATAEKLFAEQGGKFSSDWFFRVPARSFYHSLLQTDLNTLSDEQLGNGFVVDQDYIPRNLTLSSVVVEGINAGDKADEIVMWCAMGYTPCAYAIPVWVAAADEIPACLTADAEGTAAANRMAKELQQKIFPVTRGNGNKYLNFKPLRDHIAPVVEKAEKAERSAAKRQRAKIAKNGIDKADMKRYNEDIDGRFAKYCEAAREIKNK